MEDDDVGFSPGDLSGWGFTDSSGEGIDEWLGYAYGNIKDFNAASPEDIDKLFGELYGRIPDLNAASPEELDRALGEAYKAAGVQVPEAQKAGFFDAVKQALKTPAGMLTAGRALYGLLGGGDQPRAAGYQGTVPTLTSVREQIQQPEYQPYTGQATMGRRFFTDQQYTAPKDADTARAAAQTQAQQMATQIPAAPAAAVAPNTVKSATTNTGIKQAEPLTATGILQDFLSKQFAPKTTSPGYEQVRPLNAVPEAVKTNVDVQREMQRAAQAHPDNPLLKFLPSEIAPNPTNTMGPPAKTEPIVKPDFDKNVFLGMPMPHVRSQTALPGQMEQDLVSYANAQSTTNAAQGGIMGLAKGRYLRGETDGMADKIPSSIDGVQPAALSHGEFVIPADVVSHLGNGNSDAGANQLYKMMDRVRKDRTGTTKQGKKINPDKYLGGGIADYASGGVAKFQTGGSSSSALAPSASNPFGSTASTTLAPYIGDYATGMLGRAQALAQSPYQAYTGPLTAGYSPLQQQAFTAAGNINPQATFGTSDLQQYMNPYTQLSLQPQLDELRRQAEISQQNIQGQFSKAGAFGGAREAIARSENLRNLQAAQSGIIGKGFENAFNQAMGQYNVGRQQQLSDLGALAGIGAQQRGIEQEGITALQKQFEQEKMDPFTKLQFQQSMMQGLPVGTTSITPNLSDMQRTGITLKQATDMYEILKNIPGFADAIKP